MAEFSYDLIIKYLDNTISEADAKVLLEWLGAKEENRDIFFTCKKLYAHAAIGHYAKPERVEQALRHFHSRRQTSAHTNTWQLYMRIGKFAALVVLVLAMSAVLWYVLGNREPASATVSVTNTEPVKIIVLPDGSKVWLNNSSTLTYPLAFGSSQRRVSLLGEAFLEVKPDASHPFVVQANNLQVKVCGTSFNVNTNMPGNSIATVLVTGSVALRDSKGNGLAMLAPGQMGIFNQATNHVELKNVNTELYTSWRKGLFVFDKANLNEIIAKLEDAYHIRITLNSRNAVAYKINFVFRNNQSLDTVLEMLKFVAPITYKKNDDQLYINVK